MACGRFAGKYRSSSRSPSKFAVRLDQVWWLPAKTLQRWSGTGPLYCSTLALWHFSKVKRGMSPPGLRAQLSARRMSATMFGLLAMASCYRPIASGVWRGKPANTDQPTISFCNTGHWAATNWFVLSELLGHKSIKLYPESVVDWSNAGLAMQNVPTRLQQFWLQLKVASGNP